MKTHILCKIKILKILETHGQYSANMPSTYHISRHSASSYGSLVDRGANGGLAGVMFMSWKEQVEKVCVTGIDDHELPGLDIAQLEISNKVRDILRMYHSSSWHSEPYHQNQNPSEWHYRTIKAWTNTILNRSGAPPSCWLLCMSYVCYLPNHISCESLKGQISLTELYGVTPDISILMMYTFYQSVYYASHNKSFPSTSEEKHEFWVGFGEHVDDAITHKLLDSSSNKTLYRSAVHPADDLHLNKHLLPDLGESVGSNKPKPITFVKSHQDLDKSVSKPMAEYNPDDLIGRTFLLPPNQKGERQSINQTKGHRNI